MYSLTISAISYARWRRRNQSRSLSSLNEDLIKIGAKVSSHGRTIAFQMAEVAIPRQLFQEILRLITELRSMPPAPPCPWLCAGAVNEGVFSTFPSLPVRACMPE